MTGRSCGLILHVDDEQIVLDSLASLLGVNGYEAHRACNGHQALQIVREGLHPDVMILDFNLGDDMNGAEVAEQIRGILGYTPPIVMLTGDLSNAEFPCITDAPVWLVHKPINPRQLLAALPGLVQVARATRESQQRH